MKIMFNGLLEKKRSGCPICGSKNNSTERDFVFMRTYILPSGITKTFRKGKVEEVADMDGDFLLSYRYLDKHGNEQKVFEVVNDG